MLIQKIKTWAEPLIFLLVVLVNASVLVIHPLFPTVDGPAHLYNAHLISELLRGGEGAIYDFFMLNPQPIPNWMGHFLLVFFGWFLKAALAEKAVLLIYAIGFPLSFRYFLQRVSGRTLPAFLVLPFVFSYLFYHGFYNFLLGLVFMFLTLGYWYRNDWNGLRPKKIIILFLLFTTLYFSHITLFAFAGLILGLHILVLSLVKKTGLKSAFKQLSSLLLATFIPLVFAVVYTIGSHHQTVYKYLDLDTLSRWIKEAGIIISVNKTVEMPFAQKLMYLFFGIAAIGLFVRFVHFENHLRQSWQQRIFTLRSWLAKGDFWLLIFLILVAMYLKLPDADGAAGYISARISLLLFLFLIVWLSTLKISNGIWVLLAIAVVYLNFGLTKFYKETSYKLNYVAGQVVEISNHLPENSIVLPLNFSDNWLHAHFSNYLGIEKNIVILENYEANTEYFPVLWNHAKMPHLQLRGSDGGEGCYRFVKNKENAPREISHIFVIGHLENRQSDCAIITRNLLEANYLLVAKTEICSLYEIAR